MHGQGPPARHVPRVVGHLCGAVGRVLDLGLHGLLAGGGEPAGVNYDYDERRRGGDGSRSRSASLPTTGTRLARGGAPLHAAVPPPAAASPPAPRRASIHSLRTQLFIGVCTPQRAPAPRERAARARARRPARPAPPLAARARPLRHAHLPPSAARRTFLVPCEKVVHATQPSMYARPISVKN